MSDMRIVLVDETGGAPCADGSSLTADVLARAAAILEVFLNRDFAPEWGGSHTVRAGTADLINPGELVAVTAAQIDAPGAIAYHDVDGNGVPVLRDAITLSDTLMGQGNSWLVAWAHEFGETGGDEGCNAWYDDGAGNSFAGETADAVEAQSYLIDLGNGTNGYVSNFLRRPFFIPNHAGPFDFMSTIGDNPAAPLAPFQTAAGGYQIARTAGAGEHQVVARYCSLAGELSLDRPFVSTRAHRRLLRRAHPSSRSFRRGLRVQLPNAA